MWPWPYKIHTQLGSFGVDKVAPCPQCRQPDSVSPTAGRWIRVVDAKALVAPFKVDAMLTCGACNYSFIARYEGFGDSAHLVKIEPKIPAKYEVPQEILDVSWRFSEIVEQSSAAEEYGLEQIAGAGYRRALEFLIKDYCIRAWPDQADAIRRTFLATCITTYITDPVAERAVWLGNDEAHYERRWVEHDLQDLKELIQLTMVWIHYHLRTLKYIESMPAKPKGGD